MIKLVIGLIYLAAFYAFYQAAMASPRFAPHAIYWAQVLSGNWPGKVNEVSDFLEAPLSIVIALFLNLATVISVIAIFRSVLGLERRVMNIEDTYLTKEIAQKIKVIELLTSYTNAEADQVADDVDKAFKEANEVWRNEIMGKILPDRELRKLFATSLNTNFEPG